jgi:hypothetical protein
MEQNPSPEADRSLASQEIPRHLRNLKVYFCLRRIPAKCPYSEPDQSSPRTLSQFPQHPFSIIATSRPRCSSGPLSLRLSRQNPVCTRSLDIRATCHDNLILLDFITRQIFDKEYRIQSSSLRSLLNSLLTSTISGPNIFHSTLFSSTNILYSSSMWKTKFHTHTKRKAKLQLCIF